MLSEIGKYIADTVRDEIYDDIVENLIPVLKPDYKKVGDPRTTVYHFETSTFLTVKIRIWAGTYGRSDNYDQTIASTEFNFYKASKRPVDLSQNEIDQMVNDGIEDLLTQYRKFRDSVL